MSSNHLSDAIEAYPKVLGILCKLIDYCRLDFILESHSWRRESTFLAIKIVQHLHSTKRLAEATKLDADDLQIQLIDFSSVQVLIRSALETFIVYAYIYGCDDESLSIFRHNTWQFGGLKHRQNFDPLSQEELDQKNQEMQLMIELETAIRNSPHLPSIGANPNLLFRKGEWRTDRSWAKLGTEAGLHQRWIEHVYSHLSGHAHTSYASILQVDQSIDSLDDQQWLADVGLTLGLEIMTHFIDLYARNKPPAAKYLAEHEEDRKLIETWRFTKEKYDMYFNSL